MSLLCDETRRDIEFGEQLMAGTRINAKFYSALCKEVIDRIPMSLRRVKSCKLWEGGVNIHEATSTRNFNGSYTLCNFTIGKFSFSVSQKVAKRFLPNHIKSYETSS